MAEIAPRPLPMLEPLTEPFWTGGARGLLNIQRCKDCALWIHPPALRCGRCSSDRLGPEAVSGKGHVFSYTVNEQAWSPDLADPYAIAIVELDEQPGLRLTTNLIDCPAASIRVGLTVEVRFERQEDVWIPLFAPLRDGDEAGSHRRVAHV